MARIRVEDEHREITDSQEIGQFLQPFGIWYEKWDVDGRIEGEAENDEILAEYADEIERLKESGGFTTADVINVTPDTPNLDAMLDKFKAEHTHSEDEVRFTVRGRGVFHIHPENGPVFAVEVEKGDLINVPAGTRHWFNLCQERSIRCIRLFQDPSGWAPHYVQDGVHDRYLPVCMGPRFIRPSDDIDPAVEL